jgi:glucokinase
LNILSIDIGGTKFQVAVVTKDGEIVRSQKVPTPKSYDGEELFAVLCSVIAEVSSKESYDVVGVGCGGPMSPMGEFVSPLNIPGWRNFPLRSRLESIAGLPVFIDNDAKAITLAEAFFGGGKGKRNFMAMVVSTGVGAGLYCDGRLIDGESGNAGHLGHVIVEPSGHLCACGTLGCLEAEISGLSTQKILGITADLAPKSWIIRSGDLLARAVASAAALLDFECVFVGGSVALGYGDLFFEEANRALKRYAKLEFSEKVEILPTTLGPDFASLSGAAVALYRKGINSLT